MTAYPRPLPGEGAFPQARRIVLLAKSSNITQIEPIIGYSIDIVVGRCFLRIFELCHSLNIATTGRIIPIYYTTEDILLHLHSTQHLTTEDILLHLHSNQHLRAPTMALHTYQPVSTQPIITQRNTITIVNYCY